VACRSKPGRTANYCVDAAGKLQPFEERFERMIQWLQGREPALDRATAERRTLEYMGTMPAWKEHPRVKRQ